MAVAVMGVDKARSIIESQVDKYIYGKEPKTNG
jgi:hypothetical protein